MYFTGLENIFPEKDDKKEPEELKRLSEIGRKLESGEYAEELQGRIHDDYLGAFYFTPKELQRIINEVIKKEKVQ